jgi:glycosyltransferase involved in cell wall biosynthesis
MSNPPITWLMPVRDGMPYLPFTLQSIAEQTYQNHKIIVWDNGSTDGTVEELRRWIPAHIPGVMVTGRPLGVGASRAALVEMADTELCASMDADDINVRDRLERQVAFLLDRPEVVVLGGQLELIDERGVAFGRWSYKTHDAQVRWLVRWHTQFGQNSVVFRRSAILSAGNYRDVPDEDIDLWLRVAPIGEMRNLPETLVQYRRSRTSQTGKIDDFVPTDRKAAARNALLLFPNVRDADRAMELWEATHPQQLQDARSRVRHISQLRDAAVLLSQQFGKPREYFTSTQEFEDQYYSLKTRAYRRFGLEPLVALKARVMHAGVG